MAAVVAGELRKKHQSKKEQKEEKEEKEEKSTGPVFPTPARTGWGPVAAQLYPHLAQVRVY